MLRVLHKFFDGGGNGFLVRVQYNGLQVCHSVRVQGHVKCSEAPTNQIAVALRYVCPAVLWVK